MTTIKEIQLDMYPVNLFVLCTDEWDDIIPSVNKHLRKHYHDPAIIDNTHIPHLDHCTAFTLRIPHNLTSFIVFPFNPDETIPNAQLHHVPTLAGVTAHEALHVTSELMEHTGIRWDPNNDEPIAYPLGYITRKAIQIFLAFLFKLEIEVTLESITTMIRKLLIFLIDLFDCRFTIYQFKAGRQLLQGTYYLIHTKGLQLNINPFWSTTPISSCQSEVITVEQYPREKVNTYPEN